jgi:hypothetical protein
MGNEAPLKAEDKLNQMFAEAVRHSTEFRRWLLGRTRFERWARHARLLDEAEYMIRPRRYWWRHWWCGGIPECGQKETDIFLVFDVRDGFRFALHVENKIEKSRFQPLQAECYVKRARFMMNNFEYLNYSDFDTLLISPRSFKEKYSDKCALFGCHILHEDIAAFVPAFKGN